MMSATTDDAPKTPRHGETYCVILPTGVNRNEEFSGVYLHTAAQENREAPGAPNEKHVLVPGGDLEPTVLFQ